MWRIMTESTYGVRSNWLVRYTERMITDSLTVLMIGIGAIAVLYSAVGHAGASGYIAVMTLLGLAPLMIKPTALALNILVATVTTWQFMRAGHFSWQLFWPFAVLAVPAAFLGGYLTLPAEVFKIVLGVVLLYSAMRFVFEARKEYESHPPSRSVAVLVGAALGLLAGWTGTGGGIFSTPLILLMHWAQPKKAAAVSALFILVNSTAGLLGNFASTQNLPPYLWLILVVAFLGGMLGSYWGSTRLPSLMIKKVLAVVLLLAGGKLLFG
jgi:uncharacterized protein